MNLVGVHFRTQRGIDSLMALDGSLALELRGHDQRRPVTAVAIDFKVLAGQAGGDQGTQLIRSHFTSSGA
jgi:hypothetical protein